MMEGVVTQIRPNGTAQVVIQQDPGGCIPGAPGVNHCHCAGCSASITVEALNRADASVGDLVRVSHEPGAVLRSAGALIGIPLLGLIVGVSIGSILYQRLLVQGLVAFLMGGAFFVAGIAVGAFVRRRDALEKQPIVTEIMDPAFQKIQALKMFDPVCGMEVDPATASAQIEYGGRRYYFCRADCMQAFVKNPLRYLRVPA